MPHAVCSFSGIHPVQCSIRGQASKTEGREREGEGRSIISLHYHQLFYFTQQQRRIYVEMTAIKVKMSVLFCWGKMHKCQCVCVNGSEGVGVHESICLVKSLWQQTPILNLLNRRYKKEDWSHCVIFILFYFVWFDCTSGFSTKDMGNVNWKFQFVLILWVCWRIKFLIIMMWNKSPRWNDVSDSAWISILSDPRNCMAYKKHLLLFYDSC